jgi:hypothetical protein
MGDDSETDFEQEEPRDISRTERVSLSKFFMRGFESVLHTSKLLGCFANSS